MTSTFFILVFLAFSDEVASAARVFTLPREAAATIYLACDFLILMLLLAQRLRIRSAMDRKPPRKHGLARRHRLAWWIGIALILFADFYWLKPFVPWLTMGRLADGLALAVVFAMAMLILVNTTKTTKNITAWWWIGVTLMLLADFYWLKPFVPWLTMGRLADGLALAAVYAVAMLILVATAIDVDPRMAVSPKRRDKHNDWRGLAAAIPLLIGIFFAYLASAWWDLGLEPLSDLGIPQSTSTIDAQFFAQACQVLPLLILALGFEIRIFRNATATQRAAAIVSLTFLCAGEVLALSVLVKPGGSAPFDWHIYSAFVVVVTAGLIGITTVVGALLTETRPLKKPPEQPKDTQATDKRWHQAVAIGVLTTAVVASVLRRRD